MPTTPADPAPRSDIPHRAVIWVTAEVHELTPLGECSGRVAHKVPTFPLYVDGLDREQAVARLRDIIEVIEKSCPSN